MSKVADYLNEHLLGQVTGVRAARKKYSVDSSILTITPEAVALPRSTSDVRKIARFAWQLAEKGHKISLTPRGLGGDTTGGAIGKGILISTEYLDKVIHVLQKDKLVHTQAGVKLSTLQEVLHWQALTLPSMSVDGSIGGIISSDVYESTPSLSEAISKLEVILANGDVIETGKVSKRELSKKLGLQTFEGEVYRKLSGLIEDNQDLIARLADNPNYSNAGYRRITEVRRRDGSFDLTPLFVGAQGTLGIISEVVLKADFYNPDSVKVAITTDSMGVARDVAERLQRLVPVAMNIYDGDLLRRATSEGTKFSLLGDVSQIGAVLVLKFDDFSARSRRHKLKKLHKIIKKDQVGVITSIEKGDEDFIQLEYLNKIVPINDKQKVPLPIIDGSYVPSDRREEFENSIVDLASRHHIQLPLKLNVLTGVYDIYPELGFESVSDKQKIFRLMSDFASLVNGHGGSFVSSGAEGRLKSSVVYDAMDDDEQALYQQIREIFDPFNTMNPGVKQPTELRDLIANLRTSYEGAFDD